MCHPYVVEVAAALGQPTYLLDCLDLFATLWEQFKEIDYHLNNEGPEFLLTSKFTPHLHPTQFQENVETIIAAWIRAFDTNVLRHGPATLFVHHMGLFTGVWMFVVLFNVMQPSRQYVELSFGKDVPVRFLNKQDSVYLSAPTRDQPHLRAMVAFTAEAQLVCLSRFLGSMLQVLAPAYDDVLDEVIQPLLMGPLAFCELNDLYVPLSDFNKKQCWPLALFESALSLAGRNAWCTSMRAAIEDAVHDFMRTGPQAPVPTPAPEPQNRAANWFTYHVHAPADICRDGIDRVIGHDMAKRVLRALTQLPIPQSDQFEHSVLTKGESSGVLCMVHRTKLVYSTAKDAGALLLDVNLSDVMDKYWDYSAMYIQGLFETARANTPCIVLLDEVVALFDKCEYPAPAHYRSSVLRELCLQWDGIKSSPGVFVVGRTDRPFDLDDTVLWRYSQRVLVDLPTADERRALVVRSLANETLTIDPPNLVDDLLVPRLRGYSGWDIGKVCWAAAMEAAREQKAAHQ
ncbi:hypothetical protein GGF32_001348 [Allomyces javanicus]|nr:hypothetical protein GGF32_001348 [Allomyces javanicus]